MSKKIISEKKFSGYVKWKFDIPLKDLFNGIII